VKILSPIDRLEEAALLMDAGADELYGGYVSAAWREKYSMLGSANHRYFPNAQIKSEDELSGIIKEVHSRGGKFHLALNAPYYLPEQYKDMMAEAEKLASFGVDAFIVSDLGLILRMKERLPGAELHLSTLSTVFNGRSAGFFFKLGVRRMVLPRELTTAEMARIIKDNPGASFDAFVMVGKCPNVEGFCGFTHNSKELVWPCEESYSMRAVRGNGRADAIIQAQGGWSRVNRRQACGLCAVGRLRDAGINALKIVGRGGPTAVKVKVVEAVREALSRAVSGAREEELRHAARESYSGVFGSECSAYVCYFPEMRR